MRKPETHLAIGALIGSLVLLLLPLSVSGETTPTLSAVHGDASIPLAEVVKYHCHDGSYPVIRCFDTAPERDLDLTASSEAGASRVSGAKSASVFYYVLWFEHSNYGGSSFTASASYANLGLIGWNDAISSFKSLNFARPKWWQDSNYAGTAWQWPAGVWVSYVGDGANDRFSSVQNVP